MTFTVLRRKTSPRTRKKYIDFKKLLRKSFLTVESSNTSATTKSNTTNKKDISRTHSTNNRQSNDCHTDYNNSEEIKCNKSSLSCKPDNYIKKPHTINNKSLSSEIKQATTPISKSTYTDNEIITARDKQIRHDKSNHKKYDTCKCKSRKCQVDTLSCTTYNSILTPNETEDQHRNKRKKHTKHHTHKLSSDRYCSDDPLICHEDEINYETRKHCKCHQKYNAEKRLHNSAQYVISDCELSQFSTPICRDDIREEQKIPYKDCDRCLNSEEYEVPDYKYNIKSRNKRERKRSRYTDVYNDTNLYDIIPVKENCKHRRNHNVNEVLPSPKTHRPKLNLGCYYVPEIDSYVCSHEMNSNQDEKLRTITKRCDKGDEGDISYNFNLKLPQSSPFHNESSQDHSADTERSERVLNEIKDVLRTFLKEVRNVTAPVNENNSELNMSKDNGLSNDTFNQNKNQPPQYLPPPYLQLLPISIPPIYPVNCVHPNCTAVCSKCAQVNRDKKHDAENKHSLTENLVKEIYKCVIEKPTSSGTKNSKTPSMKLKTHSKSCEVFASRSSDSEHAIKNRPRTPDSIAMDKRKFKAKRDDDSETMSVTTASSISTIEKKKENNFIKLFRKIGILRKLKEEDYQIESEPQLHNPHSSIDTIMSTEYRTPRYSKYKKQKHTVRKHRDKEHMRRKSVYQPKVKPVPYVSRRAANKQPICLKEIEVRSTATQSDNKIKKYIFNVFQKQMKSIKNYKEKENIAHQLPINLNWNKGKEKEFPFHDPTKMQQNNKVRDALVMKLFTKRSPFIKNNVFVKTFMNKDTDIGQPKTIFKPPIFKIKKPNLCEIKRI